MAKAWSDFFNWVLPDVPGCTQPMAEDAIREAAIRFCDESKAWHHEPDPVDIVATQQLYPFAAVFGEDIDVVSMSVVTVNGEKITPRTPSQLKAEYGDNWDTATGLARHWHLKDENTLRLFRIPDVSIADGLVMEAIVMPSPTATGIDDIVWQSYRREISWGAKATLMASPKKPYSDPARATYFESRFVNAIAVAAMLKETGFVRQPLRSTPVFK